MTAPIPGRSFSKTLPLPLVVPLADACSLASAAMAQSDRWQPVSAELAQAGAPSFVSCNVDHRSENFLCAFVRCSETKPELGMIASTPDAAADGDGWIFPFDSYFAFRQTFKASEENGVSIYSTIINRHQIQLLGSSSLLLLTPLPSWLKDQIATTGEWVDLKSSIFGLDGSGQAANAVAEVCPPAP